MLVKVSSNGSNNKEMQVTLDNLDAFLKYGFTIKKESKDAMKKLLEELNKIPDYEKTPGNMDDIGNIKRNLK